MCDPATIIGGASLAVSVGGKIAGHKAQDDAADANERAARVANREFQRDVNLREVQEEEATNLTILQMDRQARMTKALAAVSAGESNVAGASVDALLGDLDRERADAETIERKNLAMTRAQLDRARASGRANMQNRINGVPGANPFVTGLGIVGDALDFGAGVLSRRPNTTE